MAKSVVNAYKHVSGRDLQQGSDRSSDDNGNVPEPFINASVQAGFTAGRDGRHEPAQPVERDAVASVLAPAARPARGGGRHPPKH